MNEPLSAPAGISPQRRPQSVRRTSSLQCHSLKDMHDPYWMRGDARDLYTGEDLTDVRPLAQDHIDVQISADREICALEASRYNDIVGQFIGLQAGGRLRKAMAQNIPSEVAQSTLLHRLLDDIVGTTIVSLGAWRAWNRQAFEETMSTTRPIDVTGACVSFSAGSKALTPTGTPKVTDVLQVRGRLPIPEDDPDAWHRLKNYSGPNVCRLRRIDLWKENGFFVVNSEFQDSAAFRNSEERMVIHEYRLDALVEPETFTLKEIEVAPGVLPYAECIQAVSSADRMIGCSLIDFRQSVPANLSGTAGCTHLNDVLRALQDVIPMAQLLDKELAQF